MDMSFERQHSPVTDRSNFSHDDVIKWKRFLVIGPLVDSSHRGQWRRALMLSLICAWTNGWVNNRDSGDLRRHRAHYDVAEMYGFTCLWLIQAHVNTLSRWLMIDKLFFVILIQVITNCKYLQTQTYFYEEIKRCDYYKYNRQRST